MIIRQTLLKAAAITLAAGLFAGCQGTHQARHADRSGFLQNYDQLQPGKDGQPLWFYVNPNVEFGRYQAIYLEPIKIYAAKGSLLMEASPETRQSLVNYLDAQIRDELKNSFPLVDRPGRGVMRLRIAITDAHGSMVLLDTASSVIPVSMAISALRTALTGAGSGVGSCSIEGELLDGATGERLAAGVDKRVGDKFTGKFDKFDQWHTVKTACDYWSAQLKIRLLNLQAGIHP